MSAHSKIGASSMERWSKCPGSVALSEGIEKTTSVYADEGTKAHEIAAAILQRRDFVYQTQEMMDAVQIYVDFVNATHDPSSAKVFIEQRLDLSGLHPALFGTADCVIYHPQIRTLDVIDYKHGAGIPVEAEENLQLQYYALGALLSPELKGLPVETVEVVIVQPRCFHEDGPVRRWTFPVSRMIDFALDLVDAARATEAADAPLRPGDHCRFCPAKGICPKLHETAVATAQEEFRRGLAYSPEKLAKTLTLLPAIEAWAKGVREFAYAESLHGRTPPGFKFVEKRAVRKWKNEELVVQTLGGLVTHPTTLYDMTLRSPAQMEKAFKQYDDVKQVIESLTVKESSGVTLAPESDKRKAVIPGSEFSKFPLLPDASGEFTTQNE